MSANLAVLIATYGYLAVFAGTLLEGETVLLLAGFAAHERLLRLPLVIVAAGLGGFLGDQLWFYLGRWHGQQLVDRFPRLRDPVSRATQLLDRYDTPVILAVRFLYGLRIAGPIAIGLSRVSPLRYFIFNAIGAAIWGTLFAALGYVFGHGATLILKDVERYELRFAVVVTLVIAVVAVLRWLQRRAHRETSESGAQPPRADTQVQR